MTATAIDIVKVSGSSEPVKVAGAIAGICRQGRRCEIQAIGAMAVNQSVKAVAIARGYVAPGGLELSIVPSFMDVKLPTGEERTAIKLVVVGTQR